MNRDSYKIIITLSHHRIAFEYWQRDGEDKLMPMSGTSWPAPLAFYCSQTGIEIGDSAVRAVHAGTPNAFDNYFERLPANETYIVGGQQKALRYLILDASESVFTEFFRTELLGHHGTLIDNRSTMPITIVCEADIKSNERALLSDLFRDSGYGRFKVVEYVDYIDRYLRSTLSKEYSCDAVLLAWTEGTDLTLTLFNLTKQGEPNEVRLDGLGVDPRLAYVKKLIWDRIRGQNPWLRFDEEEGTITKVALDFLNSTMPLINDTLTLSDGMDYHYSLNRTVINHLQCPEGDMLRLKQDKFLRENGIVNRQKTLLLLRGVAAGNLFFEQTLGQGFGKIIRSDVQLRNNIKYQLIAEDHECASTAIQSGGTIEDRDQPSQGPEMHSPSPFDAKNLMRMKRDMRAIRANIYAKYQRGDKTGAFQMYRKLIEDWQTTVPSQILMELSNELHAWLEEKGVTKENLQNRHEVVQEHSEPLKSTMSKPDPKLTKRQESEKKISMEQSGKQNGSDVSEGDILLKKGKINEAKRFFASNGNERMKQLCIDLLRDVRDLKAISGQTASSLSQTARENNLVKLRRIQSNYNKAGLDITEVSKLIKKYL